MKRKSQAKPKLSLPYDPAAIVTVSMTKKDAVKLTRVLLEDISELRNESATLLKDDGHLKRHRAICAQLTYLGNLYLKLADLVLIQAAETKESQK